LLFFFLPPFPDPLPLGIAEEIEAARSALDLPDLDYEATMEAKLSISRKIFDAVGDATLDSAPFKKFCTANAEWLRPYAVFCFLRDAVFGTADHWTWGSLSRPTPDDVDRLAHPSKEWHRTLQYHWYVQYHLHRQLERASKYAKRLHVALKGDLPIGVDKRSVDAWMSPRLFRMDVSTGAPPDYFDPNGQCWGFPTYNWEEMAEDGYQWWRRRLAHMAQ
jgi:4-alpha-glucanotransferase